MLLSPLRSVSRIACEPMQGTNAGVALLLVKPVLITEVCIAASKWTVRDGIARQPDEQTSQSQAWQDNHLGGVLIVFALHLSSSLQRNLRG
jgi:hypothetical protein